MDLIRVMLYGCWDGCHSPLPGVAAVFRFVEVFIGASSGGRFLVSGAPLYVGGLWGAWECGVLTSGLGASIFAFFGERTAVTWDGSCSEWSGAGRLVGGRHPCVGALRSARAGLGGLSGVGPSV